MTRLAVAAIALAALSGVAHAETLELGAKLKGTKLVKRRLDFLAQNPEAAEKSLGAGIRIVPLGKNSLPNREYFDTPNGSMSLRTTGYDRGHGLQTLKIKPGAADHFLTSQRIEVTALAGDKIGEGHTFGGSGLNVDWKAAFARLKEGSFTLQKNSTSGGQQTRYAVEKDGKHVGIVDVENHFVRNAQGTKGTGAFEYFGDKEHGLKLGQHLGLDKKAPAKRAFVPVKSLGRR